MEGVSSVMPIAVKTGASVLSAALAGGSGSSNDAVETRARNAENQAKRQAEAQARSTREQVQELREDNQHRMGAARVAAANSGLALSGSSLLNLTSAESAGDEKVNHVLDESALRIQSILDSGSEQARSIRLSGRVADSRQGGLSSLLRLGAQSLGSGNPFRITM